MHGVRSYRLDETLSWGKAPTRSEYAFVAPDRMRSVVAGTSENPDMTPGEACNACHADKSTKWAADALHSWRQFSPWRTGS